MASLNRIIEKNNLYREPLGRMLTADLSDDVKTMLETLRKTGVKRALGCPARTRSIFWSVSVWAASLTRWRTADAPPIPSAPRSVPEGRGYARPCASDCPVVEDAHAGVEAAVAGGFDCADIGDARDDERAAWRLDAFSELFKIGRRRSGRIMNGGKSCPLVCPSPGRSYPSLSVSELPEGRSVHGVSLPCQVTTG